MARTYVTKNNQVIAYRDHTIAGERDVGRRSYWLWHIKHANRPGRRIVATTLEAAKRIIDQIHAGKVAF